MSVTKKEREAIIKKAKCFHTNHYSCKAGL